jgi:hypothetical protein
MKMQPCIPLPLKLATPLQMILFAPNPIWFVLVLEMMLWVATSAQSAKSLAKLAV